MSNWVNEAVFYHIYPLGFCGSSMHHQGETTHALRKLIDWIPHLQNMHINALYLGPVFESYEHGYDTSDYRLIDHRLGTNDDFKEICEALHNAGIRIVLDGVFNHVGRAFWAFQDVQEKREQSSYCGWFHNLNFHNNNGRNDGFSYDTWEGYDNLIKLNLKNEEVIQYLLGSIAMWMDEYHIDGLRLDAADCVDQDFFRRMKTFCKEKNPDFWLMGEIIHGDYTRWANNDMLDSVTNYECYKGLYSSHNDANYFEIAHSLNRQFQKGGIYHDLILYNFVDNHDVNRLASVVKDENDIPNIYTLMFTMPGIPSIYYGSEWKIKGTKHNGSDADIRPCLHLPQMQQLDDTLVKHIAKLSDIHQRLTCFHDGEYEPVIIRNEQFIFLRRNEKETAYIVLNVSDKAFEMTLDVNTTHMEELLHHEVLATNNHTLHVTVAPKSAAIYIACKDTKQIEKMPSVKKKNVDIQVKKKKSDNDVEVTKKTKTHFPIKKENANMLGLYKDLQDLHYTLLYVAYDEQSKQEYAVYRELFNEERVLIMPLSSFQKQFQFLRA